MMAALSDPKLQFMLKLRDFGTEKVKELKPDGYNCNQYIVACIASEEEIEDRHNTIIEDAKGGKTDLEEEYYFSKRLVVIMNNAYWHGEARLLDSTMKIWKRVADGEPEERAKVSQKTNFVGKMKENFRCGVIGAPKIWLFSHFIPCTDPRHRCAKLIEEYVKETRDEILLSYERSHDDTDEEKARAILSENENITIIRPWKQDQEEINEQADSFLERVEDGNKRKRKKRKERETEIPAESSDDRHTYRKRKRERSE